MSSNVLFIRITIVLFLIFLFNIVFRVAYNKMEKDNKNKGGKNLLIYRKNIYIMSISLTLVSLGLVPIFIYSSLRNGEKPTPTLYVSFFILTALIFGHIAQLIKTI